MAKFNYPLRPNYTQFWYKVDVNKPDTVYEYVRSALYAGRGLSQETCELNYGILTTVHIVDLHGKPFTKKPSSVELCIAAEYQEKITHVMIKAGGIITVHKAEPISFKDTLIRFIQTILRTGEVMIPIMAVTGGTQLSELAAVIQGWSKKARDTLLPFLRPVLEQYQKKAAWLSDIIHFDLLKNLHDIGRVISPEYDAYWIEQEIQLAGMSQRIFGNTTHLSIYIHLAEMVYTDLALRAGKNPDDARYEGLQHGADTMKKLRLNIRKYEANPSIVWSFVMNETFGAGNPYIAAEAGLEGADIFLELDSLGKSLEDMKETMNRLEVYNTELDKLNLTGLTGDVKELGNVLNSYYDERIEPVIREVNKITIRQGALLNKIERERAAEELSRKRSHLMATPPADLTAEDKKLQASQFTDLFSNAIDPSDDVSRRFRQDIESIIEAIYE